MGSNKVIWHAPRWSTSPKQWWTLKKHVFSTGPIFRITSLSLILMFLVIASFKIAVPGIVIPNPLLIILIVPLMFAYVAVMMAFQNLFPTIVTVKPSKIVLSHGESTTLIQPEWLTEVFLAIHDEDKARITFRYVKKGKRKSCTVGISGDLDLFELESLLPVKITTKNYRRRTPENSFQANSS